MSEEKLYAVKNDIGEFLSFSDDGDSVWNKAVGHFETDKQKARAWAYNYGGHVVELVEQFEGGNITKTEALAKIIREAKRYADDYISDDTLEFEIKLALNAYKPAEKPTPEKEKKYNVKVPHTKDVWYYKSVDGNLRTIFPEDKKLRGTFTESEIEHYGLQDCEKVWCDSDD